MPAGPNCRPDGRRKLLGLFPAVAVLSVLVAAQLGTSPVGAQPRENVLEPVASQGLSPQADRASLLHLGADVLGPVPATMAVNAEVYLRSSASAALSALATAVSSPGSALYHHYLTVKQFAARFGAPATQVHRLDAYLRSYGLAVGPLAPNGLAQTVRGQAPRVSAAFDVALQLVRVAGGQLLAAELGTPELPSALAQSVALVGGLAPWAHPVDDLAWSRRTGNGTHTGKGTGAGKGNEAPQPAGPGATSAANCPSPSAHTLTSAQLAEVYGLDGFYSRGDQGQGQTVGLIEYALPDKAAVTTFEACTGSTASITYLKAPDQPLLIDPEVATDIEVVAGLAPRANIDAYVGTSWGSGLQPWQMAISGQGTARLPQVISSSWGNCEAAVGLEQSDYTAEEQLFEEAAAQGQTVLAASGDDGSEACIPQSGSQDLAVDDPASAPFVTAVGGTASDSVEGNQYVWDSRSATASACLGTGCKQDGASGGGASQVWPRPSYQQGLPPAPPGTCSMPAGCREVPDVSALSGDPYSIYCSPAVCSELTTGTAGGWQGLVGTSLAAPAWDAAVALSDEECEVGAGFLNPLLYREPTALLGSVTEGNNDFSGTNHGLFPASSSGSYSMATGLGYLGGADLSAGQLCGGAQSNSSPPTTAPGTANGGAPPPSGLACPPAKDHPLPRPSRAVAIVATQGANTCPGYWVATSTGQVTAFGGAASLGVLNKKDFKGTVVAMAAPPGRRGYWLLSSGGGVFAFGDAGFYGAPASFAPSSPAIAIASTPDGRGYWVTTAKGRVYGFGDARAFGSLSLLPRTLVATGLAPVSSGAGYWVATSAGRVQNKGGAPRLSEAGLPTASGPVVAIVAGPGPASYRLVTASGSTYSFGTPALGGLRPGQQVAPVTAATATPDGKGYYLMDSDGHVYAFGDARYLGGVATGVAQVPGH